ncbi:MAG TPA: 30S ribosomal protein S17 [Thermodesulfobacteriaceae bacterium]|nr:30S ribosomal protein S17 [Thermodesulfobacteriaceae bacterium]
MSEKKNRRTLIGTVTSDKMDKTVTVTVTRRFQHPIYGKFVQRQKKYMAHDPDNTCRQGDRILIEESRPMSRRKRWMVRDIIERAV